MAELGDQRVPMTSDYWKTLRVHETQHEQQRIYDTPKHAKPLYLYYLGRFRHFEKNRKSIPQWFQIVEQLSYNRPWAAQD